MTYFTITTPDGPLHFPTERKAEIYKRAHPDAVIEKHEVPLDLVKDLHKLSKKKIKPKCPTCGK